MPNYINRKSSVDLVSRAIAQLVPKVIRGVQLDFFLKRRITQTQLLMLMAIQSSPRCSMSDLAHNFRVSLPTTTGIVSRLVNAGYIRRLSSIEDRRQVSVELTSKGYSFIEQFQLVVQQRWKQILKSLQPRELSAFYNVTVKLNALLAKRA